MYESAKAAITKYQRLHVLDNINLPSYSSVGQKFEDQGVSKSDSSQDLSHWLADGSLLALSLTWSFLCALASLTSLCMSKFSFLIKLRAHC